MLDWLLNKLVSWSPLRLWTFVILSFLIAAEVVSLIGEPTSICIVKPTDYGEYYTHHDKCPSFHVFFFKTSASVLETIGHEWLIAIAAIATAFFTFTLWWSTNKLFLATNTAIGLATDEFNATHRPRLRVRQFVLDEMAADQIVTAKFAIVNIGETDAIWRYIAGELALWDGQTWLPPGIDEDAKSVSLPPIKNGQRVQTTIQSRFKISVEQITGIKNGTLFLCAVGELTYRDQGGTNRRTGFRRNYDPKSQFFVATDNPDQEYED